MTNKIDIVWGDIGLENKDFTQVPFLFSRNQGRLGVSPVACQMILVLMSYKWDHQNPFPSIASLAEAVGSTERTVQRTLKQMEADGLLRREYRRRGKENDTTVYDLTPLFDRMRTLLKGDSKPVVVEESKPVAVEPQIDLSQRHLTFLMSWIGTAVEDIVGMGHDSDALEKLKRTITAQVTKADIALALLQVPPLIVDDQLMNGGKIADFIVERKHGAALRKVVEAREALRHQEPTAPALASVI